MDAFAKSNALRFREVQRAGVPHTHPKYRPDVDGLRAIAVLPVVAFHAFPSAVPGGFIGVDIFFVISGFLISQIVFTGLDRGTFSFLTFYQRRIRRIFPALILVLVSSAAFGWLTLLSVEYSQLGKHIVSAAAFVSNFTLWQESGYFDRASETKPLLHLWSLGIEEQFYLAWPLIAAAAWRFGVRILYIAALIAAVSFAWNIATPAEESAAMFYSPATRIWELLLGSGLAAAMLYGSSDPVLAKAWPGRWLSPRLIGALPSIRSAIGAALIALGLLTITKNQPYPSFAALLPVLGAVLVISAKPDAWFNRTILASRPMVWVGLISYPLYLWHWPILSYSNIVAGGQPALIISAGCVAASLVLAWLTYTFVEKPIRFGGNARVKVASLASGMAVCAAAGLACFVLNGFPNRYPEVDRVARAAGEWEYPGAMVPYGKSPYRRQVSAKSETTLFVGDSNMDQYYPRVAKLIETSPQTTNSIIFATAPGCLPVPNVRDDARSRCTRLMPDAKEIVRTQPDITTVVIGGNWLHHFQRDGVYLLSGDERMLIKEGAPGYARALEELSNFIEFLREANKRVYLLINMPAGSDLDPRSMVKRDLLQFPNVLQLDVRSIRLDAFLERYARIRADLISIARRTGADVIDPLVYLCNEEICPGVDADGEAIYRDWGHLRPYYVKNYAVFIDQTVAPRADPGIAEKGKAIFETGSTTRDVPASSSR